MYITIYITGIKDILLLLADNEINCHKTVMVNGCYCHVMPLLLLSEKAAWHICYISLDSYAVVLHVTPCLLAEFCTQLFESGLYTRTHSFTQSYFMFCRCTHGAATCVDSLVMPAVLSLYLSKQRCIHSVLSGQLTLQHYTSHLLTYFWKCFSFFFS